MGVFMQGLSMIAANRVLRSRAPVHGDWKALRGEGIRLLAQARGQCDRKLVLANVTCGEAKAKLELALDASRLAGISRNDHLYLLMQIEAARHTSLRIKKELFPLLKD
jgi:hypothetical protein